MKRSAKNILAVLAGDLARRLTGFAALAILARRGGTDVFGMFALALTVLTYGIMLSSSGLHLLGVRETAAGRYHSVIGEILGARVVLSCIAWLLTAIAVLFIHDKLQAAVIFIVSFSLIPNALLLDWFYQGKERMGYVVIARWLSALVYLLVIVVAVHRPEDIVWVGAGAVAGDLLAAVFLFALFHREDTMPTIVLNPSRWLGHVRTALPLGTGSVLGALSINFPPLAIGIFLTAGDVGVYSAAARLVVFLLVIDRIAGQVLLPATVRLYADDRMRFSAGMQRALKWVVLLSVPAAVGGALLAGRIIPFVYGTGFSAAAPMFQIMVWFLPITLVHTIYTSGMIAIHAERRYGRVMMVGAAAYAAAVLAGIAVAGAQGAAAGVIVAETITMVLMRQAFMSHIRVPWPKGIIRILLAAVVMGGIIYLLPNISLIPVVALAGGAYVIMLFAARVIDIPELLQLVRQTA